MDTSDALSDMSHSYSEDNITDGNVDDYVAYDGDTSQFDYVQYMPGDTLQQVHTTWPQDSAFIPTSITYSLAFIVGEYQLIYFWIFFRIVVCWWYCCLHLVWTFSNVCHWSWFVWQIPQIHLWVWHLLTSWPFNLFLTELCDLNIVKKSTSYSQVTSEF